MTTNEDPHKTINLSIIGVIHDEVDMTMTVDKENDYEARDALLERLSDLVRLEKVFTYFSKIPFVQPTFDFEMDDLENQFGSFQPTSAMNPFSHKLERLRQKTKEENFNPFNLTHLWDTTQI